LAEAGQGQPTFDLGVSVATQSGIELRALVQNVTDEVGLTEGNSRASVLGTGTVGDATVGRPIFGRNFTLSLGKKWVTSMFLRFTLLLLLSASVVATAREHREPREQVASVTARLADPRPLVIAHRVGASDWPVGRAPCKPFIRRNSSPICARPADGDRSMPDQQLLRRDSSCFV